MKSNKKYNLFDAIEAFFTSDPTSEKYTEYKKIFSYLREYKTNLGVKDRDFLLGLSDLGGFDDSWYSCRALLDMFSHLDVDINTVKDFINTLGILRHQHLSRDGVKCVTLMKEFF